MFLSQEMVLGWKPLLQSVSGFCTELTYIIDIFMYISQCGMHLFKATAFIYLIWRYISHWNIYSSLQKRTEKVSTSRCTCPNSHSFFPCLLLKVKDDVPKIHSMWMKYTAQKYCLVWVKTGTGNKNTCLVFSGTLGKEQATSYYQPVFQKTILTVFR